MSESLTPLTEQALTRLRKLASENGIAPEKIELFGTDEQTYTLRGKLLLTPKCDIQTGRYPGPPKGGKGRKVFPNFEAMHSEVQRRKSEFESGRSWVDASLKELKAAPGEGWGLEGAQITLPDQSITLSASTACPTCHGQKLITCAQCGGQGTFVCQYCRGSRQEVCYACSGTGNSPQDSNQRCVVCGGRRSLNCRHCGGTGQMTCPNCQGRRGTPCPGCNGTGLVSEDVTINCTVETHFKLDPEGLPSGLRSGLGRLGTANLAKGHADIKQLVPVKDEKESKNNTPETHDDGERKTAAHSINFEAIMPYADIRMNLNGHKAVVVAFGKRGALLNVPNFLDDALKSAREKLAQAAKGAGDIDEILQVAVIKTALQLELSGKGNVTELRRHYSIGLSQEVMREILQNLRLSLKQHTLKTRGIIAGICGVVSGAFFSGLYLTGLRYSLTQGWPPQLQMLADIAILALPIILGWLALNLATRATLQRRFNDHTITLQQTVGKIGYSMFAAIVGLYGVILMLASVKPFWLLQILSAH